MAAERLLALGILVHIIYLASIFDIYFTSPLVHGMTPYKSKLKPPAKRLVLFVADGLRADKLFELDEHGETRAPYLRDLVEKKASWGVSHTRVPTESRPGHVALIAGFYEDVSAVAKGWKENPVEFDSTFNESRTTWAWGSPDILPMFSKGASGDHVFTSMYKTVAEDFGDEDASKLDTWVFEKVQQFFGSARNNDTLRQMLLQDQIVFFLHLLGIDTNGHAHRPTSTEYLKNIGVVDKGIQEIEKLIEKFYDHDGLTAYVVTADHGMTNWGSHGTGHPHETLTPLLAWGAGIKGPSSPQYGMHDIPAEMYEWKLDHLHRNDVNQADIAPLMTSLIGVSFPLNSVGILPVAYLNNTEQYVAENLFMNAQQILAQYEVKEMFRKETSLLFRPFTQLSGAKRTGLIRDIKEFMRNNQSKEAISQSKELIELALEGLNYYQNYDRVFLNIVVTLGFLGWILCIVLQIIEDHSDVLKEMPEAKHKPKDPLVKAANVDSATIVFAILVIVLLLVQRAPWMYYSYCLLPFAFWNRIGKRLHIIYATLDYIRVKKVTLKTIFTLLFGLFSLEILVLSFFRREILSVGLVCLAFWPFTTMLFTHCRTSLACWTVLSFALSVFPILPVVGREANYFVVSAGGVLTLIVFSVMLLYSSSISHLIHTEIAQYLKIVVLQLLLAILALYTVNSTASSLKLKLGLPVTNQFGSWTILLSSFLLPLINSSNLAIRFWSVASAFSSVFLLMSTAYEGLFLLVLSLLMGAWLLCENKLSGKTTKVLLETQLSNSTSASQPAWKVLTEGLNSKIVRKLTLEDLRIAYFFVFFIIVAFFGTGNIASINSFDPASVYCFLTVFSPFTMGALLLCKVLIPFVIVTCAFDAIHVILSIPVQSLVLVVLVMTDLMSLHFFYLVQDSGSWRDIGTSISHYVIMMAFIIFLLPIFGLARLFTGASLTLRKSQKML
ncbi:GPI ethanolamine phosphate transferase 1-like [Montipora foliosa]|uniref:GPI ethanolamine phosphate transferase 1-like n=1 Tax=Montipora foliosa TaxID=591990 RepID=UPI0035F16E02